MPLILKNVKLPLAAEESSLKQIAARALAVPEETIRMLRIVRISIDARKKEDICRLFSLWLQMDARDEKRILVQGRSDVSAAVEMPEAPLPLGEASLPAPIVVAGMGPAGLFAAYMLAEMGYKPIVLERGRCIEARSADVERFCATGALDMSSNVMFGEGGAGTFSDGKLMTRIKDPRAARVLDIFAQNGAGPDICVQARPHIGTDRLRLVVRRMREKILEAGGEIRFETRLSALERQNGILRAVRAEHGGAAERIACGACVLATGQGARDTYAMLLENGFALSPKAFAVGVRIEHPREMIDAAQFGKWAGDARLGAAEYHLSAQDGGRGVYTFCMCPGGVVIPSASASEEVVTNGMSDYARDGRNSNAAIVVQVGPEDFGKGPLDGIRFQQAMEQAAYRLGGGGYAAPVCCAGDFLFGRGSVRLGDVTPTYRPAVTPCDLTRCLPDFVAYGVRTALRAFGRQLKGFAMPEAVLTGVESRTSSPVRILRNEQGEALGCGGLYPVGEGAGYAGGIVSAAVDGMRAAERIMALYKPHD